MAREVIDRVQTHIAGHWLFVTVTTQSGVRGIGESTYFLHPPAVRAVLDEVGAALIGRDAFAPEAFFNEQLKHHCLRDSVQSAALSAIDQALWDIKARALGVPIWELLGGRVRDRVRAILLIEAPEPDALVDTAIAAVEEGFTALKIKPFIGDWAERSAAHTLVQTSALFSRVREAVGWDVDLAVEVHRNLPPADAATFAERIRPDLPYFIEDPVTPFSLATNAHVAGRLGAPTALAERNLNIWEFREYSDCHDVTILRPDIGLAGGYTQLKKIAAIAESRHQRIVPHNFTSPVATAGHIQLAACTTNWDVQGYVREDRAPWRDVVHAVNRLEKGFLAIPDTPGCGVELNYDYLEHATYEPFGRKFLHEVRRGADGAVKLI